MSTVAAATTPSLFDGASWSQLGTSCVALHRARVLHRQRRLANSFDNALRLTNLLASTLEDDIEDSVLVAVPRHLWDSLSYVLYRRVIDLVLNLPSDWTWREKASLRHARFPEIDQWVISYEERLQLGGSTYFPAQGLVEYNSIRCVIPDARIAPFGLELMREPAQLPGLVYLAEFTPTRLTIHSSTGRFCSAFNLLTGNVLDGLNWDNVAVAGGIVVGSLLYVRHDVPPSGYAGWDTADIDLYVYGLSVEEANQKIKHIRDVYFSHIPPRYPRLAVRTGKTITFGSASPFRRVQVVLKLCRLLRDVLFNFDLDICAMAWTGSRLWLAPRAARALETGCNTFTMDLVQGHYLERRRSTRIARMVKYGYRGFGIRFLEDALSVARQSLADDVPVLCTPSNFAPALARATATLTEEAVARIAARAGAVGVPRLRFDRLQPGVNPLGSLSGFLAHMHLWKMERQGRVVTGTTKLAPQESDDENDDDPDYDGVPPYETFPPAFRRIGLSKQLLTPPSAFPLRNAFGSLILHFYSYTWQNIWSNAQIKRDFVALNSARVARVRSAFVRILPRLEERTDFMAELKDRLAAATFLTISDLDENTGLDGKDPTPAVLLPTAFAVYATATFANLDGSSGAPILRRIDSFSLASTEKNAEHVGLYLWRRPIQHRWEFVDVETDEICDILDIFQRLPEQMRRNADEDPRHIVVRLLAARDVWFEGKDPKALFVDWLEGSDASLRTDDASRPQSPELLQLDVS